MKTEITTESLYHEARTLCRNVAGCSTFRCPVKVVKGDQPPTLEGSSFHHVNKSGQVIRFPSAYRRCYGKPIYVASTHCVVVGAEWLRGRI